MRRQSERATSALAAAEVAAAATRFASTFVLPTKRERAALTLSSPRRRRAEILGAEPWIEPALRCSAERAAMTLEAAATTSGILFTRRDATRASLSDAAAQAAGEDALFVATDGELAVYFFEVGEPTVCSLGCAARRR